MSVLGIELISIAYAYKTNIMSRRQREIIKTLMFIFIINRIIIRTSKH